VFKETSKKLEVVKDIYFYTAISFGHSVYTIKHSKPSHLWFAVTHFFVFQFNCRDKRW